MVNTWSKLGAGPRQQLEEQLTSSICENAFATFLPLTTIGAVAPRTVLSSLVVTPHVREDITPSKLIFLGILASRC